MTELCEDEGCPHYGTPHVHVNVMDSVERLRKYALSIRGVTNVMLAQRAEDLLVLITIAEKFRD